MVLDSLEKNDLQKLSESEETMTDEDKCKWLMARVKETQTTFKHANDEDKYHALEMLELTVQRIKAAVLADIFISTKAYPAKTSPWFES